VYPSRGHWLPCGYPPSVQKCVADGLITPDFPDSHAVGAVAWFPPRLWVPFPRGRSPASRSPWTTSGGITPYHQLHPLRSVPPFTSPFAPTRVTPCWRPILSWVSSPLKTTPSRASEPLTRPSPKGRTRRFIRRLATRHQGPAAPSTGRNLTKDPKIHDSASSAVPAPVWNGPHRLSAATRSLLTFQPGVTTRPRPSELLSARDVGSSPKRSAGLL